MPQLDCSPIASTFDSPSVKRLSLMPVVLRKLPVLTAFTMASGRAPFSQREFNDVAESHRLRGLEFVDVRLASQTASLAPITPA